MFAWTWNDHPRSATIEPSDRRVLEVPTAVLANPTRHRLVPGLWSELAGRRGGSGRRDEPARPFRGGRYFVIGCGFSHANNDDAIALGGKPGSAHNHGWGCGGLDATPCFASIPSCGPERSLHFRVTFPNCWNGDDLDSPDHKRHVTYSAGRRCPGSHPVAIPTIVLIFLYPSTELGRPLQASGRFGAHGDFINGWVQETLARLVRALN